MDNFKNNRKVVSVTMTAELYDRLVRHCKDNDVPVSVWCRALIQQQLP